MPDSAYAAVPYDDRPVAQAHPRVSHAHARAWGIAAASPPNARVLELGCANGVNLIPMAARHPDAHFLGVDLAENQIAVAQRRVTSLGLTNVEFRCADVLALDLGDDEYDYIIAHGLFSWVPDAVRDGTLALCRKVLASTGVAYISYNALPAWGVRDGIRHVLELAAQGVGSVREQIAEARAVLHSLGAGEALSGTVEGVWLQHEIEALATKPDAYLVHEYLVPAHRAFYVREFVEWAGRHELRYLDDVAPVGVDDDVVASLRASFETELRDRMVVEQMLDVAIFRQFRATLLVGPDVEIAATKAEVVLEVPSPPPVAGRPRALALARLEAAELGFVSTAVHDFVPLDQFHQALLELLDGSRTLQQLSAEIEPRVAAGEIPLRTVSGTQPTPEELRAGLEGVISHALEQFAGSGLLLPPPPIKD